MPAAAVIHITIDPVIHLGPFAVHWYGVMYVIAFVVAFRYGVVPHVVPRGLDRHDAETMVAWVIVAGLVGARLYYDVQQPLATFSADPIGIIAVWRGGMDFFGAIFAGVATIVVLAKRRRRNVWLLLDAAALFAVVGQPIGRIGNIINGDILGGVSTLPWATAYDNPNAILQTGFSSGVPYQPAGAYEALVTIIIGLGLFWLRRRHPRDGVLFIVYVTAYAASQFLLFFVRQSEPVVAWGLRQSQWTCLVMLVVGIPILIWLWRRSAQPVLKPSGAAKAASAAPESSTPVATRRSRT